MQIPLAQITIGPRFRQDLGDIAELAESIQTIGLLHPIIVTTSYDLIVGRRRLAAHEHLGLPTIEARILDLDNPLSAEFDENERRKNLNPSEKVAITEALYAHEQAKAKERQREAGKKHGRGKIASGESPEAIEAHPQVRDAIAAVVGWGGQSYERARKVVAAAREDPEEFQPLVEQMDRTGNVTRAFHQLPPYLQHGEEEAGDDSPPPTVRRLSYGVVLQRVDACFQKTVTPQLKFMEPAQRAQLRDLYAFHLQYLDEFEEHVHAQLA